MSLLADFRRTSKARPCPVCKRPDWCLVSRDDAHDPSTAICQRVESGRRYGEAGWLHRLRPGARRHVRRTRSFTVRGTPDFGDLARECYAALEPNQFVELSNNLLVSSRSLHRIDVGWNGWAFTFPMRDAGGKVIGIRLRRKDGSKLAVKGSRQGLFVPKGLIQRDPLLVCEGPTDTASMLDLGFDAVGRPNCTSGVRLLTTYVARHGVPRTVVVADTDNVGISGARRAAAALAAHCDARVIVPPTGIKDARDWVINGATRAEIKKAISRAHPVSLVVKARMVLP